MAEAFGLEACLGLHPRRKPEEAGGDRINPPITRQRAPLQVGDAAVRAAEFGMQIYPHPPMFAGVDEIDRFITKTATWVPYPPIWYIPLKSNEINKL